MSKLYEPTFAHPQGALVKLPASIGILQAYTAGTPTASAAGFAKGCLNFDVTNGIWYRNTGTVTTATWEQTSSPVDISGLLATAAEINRTAKLSTRIVDCTAASLALTVALHDGKTVTLNAATGIAISLPDSTAGATLGARFKLFVGTTVTTTSVITITRDGTATFFGQIIQLADGGNTLAAYELPGSTVITLGTSSNSTGGTKGDYIDIECVASGVWRIQAWTTAAGTEATPVT